MVKEYAGFIFSVYIPIIALFGFITFFVAMLFWVFNKKNKSTFDHAQNMPLSDGERETQSKNNKGASL